MADANNTHFRNIDRAPYELGYLLLKLPRYASSIKSKDADAINRADAAINHAENARETLLSGLEAIGSVMFVAGANDKNELDVGALSSLGCLIKHIAQELQFLGELRGEFGEIAEKGGA